MNRTSTCHHSVSSESTIIPFGRHDHVRLPRVASYPRVDLSTLLPHQKQTIFNWPKTRICLDDTWGRGHSSGRDCRAAVYASGLRRRPECVHFRQRGLRDVAVLSHETVIVRASRRDAHRDRYSRRIHLLFKRIPCDKRSGVSSGVLGGRAAPVLFTEIEPVDRSDFRAHLAALRTKLMSDMVHLLLFITSGRSIDDRVSGAHGEE